MDPSADVVVVGGGIVGAATAYELACAGVKVMLVDASLPGRASDAGAGIVSPETFTDPDEEWFRFGIAAAAHLRTLISRLNDEGAEVGPEVFDECGSLLLALAEHEDPWFTEILEQVTRRSANVGEIGEDEARAMFPPLGRLWRAAHSTVAARLDGRGLCKSIRAAARNRGAEIITGHGVELQRRADRVSAIRLADGVAHCGSLVLAAGAWSARVAHQIGVDLPVSPTKGQILHVRLPAGQHGDTTAQSGQWSIVQPIFNFYLVPWPDGRVACGGTFETEAGFDTRPTAGGIRDLLRECTSIAPGLVDAEFLEVRVGLRPSSTDERPLIGPLPELENVHVCTGHGANGLLMGPYSAALLAASLLGEEPAELQPYTVGRFCGPGGSFDPPPPGGPR